MRSILLLSLVLAVGALVACGGGETTQEATPLGARGGGTPPMYAEPVLLVEGDYLPADFPFEPLAEEGVAAEAADAEKSDFEGTLAGVRLYPFAHASNDPSVEKKQCVVAKFREADDMKFTYLPGGTYANGPEFAGVCERGDDAYIMREFTTKHGSFKIIFAYGEAALGHDASGERVEAEKIAESEGVVIRPPLEEGFGRGWAAYATPNGIVIVDGHNLPASELVKIAGGVRCSVC